MMARGCEELDALTTNQPLKKEIEEKFTAYEHMLGDRRFDKATVFERFIADEKAKIDFLDNIETQSFSLEGKHVLDAGCGKGGAAISCSLRGAASVTGFDIDRVEVDIARRRAESVGITNITFFQAAGESVQLPTAHFDVVVAMSVLEHVKDLEQVVRNLARAMRIGGCLCLTCPNPIYPREAHYKIFWIPYMPKTVGRIYLKMRGLSPTFFLEHMTYPYPSFTRIEKALKSNHLDPQDVVAKAISAKLYNPASIENTAIRRIVKLLATLKLNTILGRFVAGSHLPYPHIRINGKKVKETK
jgi:2-polyprenyl-3-methyl-5-hydroxy-6-metoxy-1,4-benzoquinol methylase